MRHGLLASLLLASAMVCAPALAQADRAATAERPVTTEYYYRIKWGAGDEFKRLYERNHAPILREMMKLGFITVMKMEEPFTHLAGGPRWDLRVTLTFRDAASAVGSTDAYGDAATAIAKRLYPDKSAFDSEEAKRFSLLEDHWDVIVMSVEN